MKELSIGAFPPQKTMAPRDILHIETWKIHQGWCLFVFLHRDRLKDPIDVSQGTYA